MIVDDHINNDMNINMNMDVNMNIDITQPPHAPRLRTAKAWGGVGEVGVIFISLAICIENIGNPKTHLRHLKMCVCFRYVFFEEVVSC